MPPSPLDRCCHFKNSSQKKMRLCSKMEMTRDAVRFVTLPVTFCSLLVARFEALRSLRSCCICCNKDPVGRQFRYSGSFGCTFTRKVQGSAKPWDWKQCNFVVPFGRSMLALVKTCDPSGRCLLHKFWEACWWAATLPAGRVCDLLCKPSWR